jgi:hypothetical protein
MLLQGHASLKVKTNPSLSAALTTVSGAVPTSQPSRATSGHIFRDVCIRVVTQLISMEIAVADGVTFIDPPKPFPLTSPHRYYRLDDYRTHWAKRHEDQKWVKPPARERLMSLWQEYCEERNKLQCLIISSPFIQQVPGLAFAQASSVEVTPPSAPLPTAGDTPAMPVRLAHAGAQTVLAGNGLGLFGQNLFASLEPLPDANAPLLTPPPSAYNHPATSFSFPSTSGHTRYSGYTPIETTFGCQSSSVFNSSVPIPSDDGNAFAGDGASYQLQACLKPFRALDSGLHPSQVENQDWSTYMLAF